jgi:ADP-heptose:LPS heptosyltransferase
MRDRLGNAEKILAIRLDTIGDVVMTAPALMSLRAHGARVTLLTSTVAAPLSPMMPALDDVVALDVPWMRHSGERRESVHHREVVAALARRGFDAAVIFTVSTQDPSCAAYLAYQAGIPRVAAHVSGKNYALVTDPVEDSDTSPPTRHEVRRQLDLTAALGFEVPATGTGISVPQRPAKVDRLLQWLDSRRWCLVHPGASAQSRRYSPRLWSQTIDLLAEHGVHTVIAGDINDGTDITEIAMGCTSSPRRIDGELDLAGLTSLIAAAPAAITCNSAAAHIAAAVGTPLVTLYAATNPQHTPFTDKAVVLRRRTDCEWCLSSTCRYGDPRCIWDVAPEEIAEGVLQWLSGRSSLSSCSNESQRRSSRQAV